MIGATVSVRSTPMASTNNAIVRKGFILRTIDYKDTSKLLYAYTLEGHASMIARGVKKMNSPLRHQAQTHMLLEMTLSSGKFPTLKEATLLDYYKDIKSDYIKTNVLSVISELIYYNVTFDDNHPLLFQFLLKVTNALKTTSAPLEILAIFEMKFLHFEGIGLNLKACDTCGQKEDLLLDGSAGILTCSAHANKQHNLYETTYANALQTFYYVDILTFTPLCMNDTEMRLVLEIIDGLYMTHLAFNSKAKRILKSLL